MFSDEEVDADADDDCDTRWQIALLCLLYLSVEKYKSVETRWLGLLKVDGPHQLGLSPEVFHHRPYI